MYLLDLQVEEYIYIYMKQMLLIEVTEIKEVNNENM